MPATTIRPSQFAFDMADSCLEQDPRNYVGKHVRPWNELTDTHYEMYCGLMDEIAEIHDRALIGIFPDSY